MGLFSFIKNAGAKLQSKKRKEAEKPEAPSLTPAELNAEKADELVSLVKALGLKVDGLYVAVEDDVVTIAGVVPSQAEKEKVILAAGNVEGIAQVDDRMEVVQKSTSPVYSAPEIPSNSVENRESVFHEVVGGDTLGKISKHYYGDASKYVVIFEANQPMLEDPDKIYVGQILRIPSVDA